MGTPVVGSKMGGIPELIEPGKTGELFEAGNVEDLMKAIKKVIQTQDVLERYTKNCSQVKYETTESYYIKLMKIYRGRKECGTNFFVTHFILFKDYELRKLLWQSGGGTAVCKKYLKFRDIAPEKLTFPENQVDEPIWLFWNTGLELAPEIVRTCYQSVKKYAGRQVVLLTENNVQNYINMPDYLNEKLKSGVLPLAIYTDLMRVALLEHYGGTWMDATILLTDEIPQEILNSDFFVFHNSLGEIDNPVLYPVWFIHAKQHNRTICEIRNVLFAYWKQNNHVPEYLFSNIVITQIMRSSPEVEKKMPYLNSDYSEYLVRVLGDRFTEEKFNWIKRLTGIHKLTYKLEPSIDKEETVYHYLVRNL